VANAGATPGATVNVLPTFTVPEITGVGAVAINGNVTAAVAALVFVSEE
jgi:hypothetical protein